MPKRYKIHRAPPQTEKDKHIAHQKQRINQADNSYLKNARVLLPASLIVVLLPGLLLWFIGRLPVLVPAWVETAANAAAPANAAVHFFGGGPTALSRYGLAVLRLTLQILLAPVTLLGFTGLCLKVWRGRKCRLLDLFAYARGGRYAPALAFSAAFLVATRLIWEIGGLLPPLDWPGGTAVLAPGIAARLALWSLALWLLLRLLPAPLLHILAPQPPPATLRAAWRLTTGRLGGLLRYGLRLLLRTWIGLALYAVLMLALGLLPVTGTALALLAALSQYLILALVAPLLWIGAIGCMDPWLPSDSQARKKGSQPDA